MKEINIIIPFLSALIPLIIGAIYYHPKVMGNTWMKVSGTTEEKIKSGNMILIFGLSYLFSLFIVGALIQFAIHQTAIPSLFADPESVGVAASEANEYIDNFNNKYGHIHRTFSHGVVHGIFATLLFAFPLIAINALFERRGWKYIWIHAGYWLISLVLMSGVICAFL